MFTINVENLKLLLLCVVILTIVILFPFGIHHLTHLSTSSQKSTQISMVQESMEKAYFEGQRDALIGDIRIEQNGNGCWYWIKSPWDQGRKPIFNPFNVCGQDID